MLSALLLAIAVYPTFAQDNSGEFNPDALKEPTRGTMYGASIWGGGHFYAGETNRGLLLLGAGLGSLAIGTALYDGTSTAPLTVGYLGSIAAWGYSIYDGGKAVRRHNDRVRQTVGHTKVEVSPTFALHNERPAPGLALRVSF